MSKEDKVKLDGLESSFSYEFLVDPLDWEQNDDGDYVASVKVPDLASNMYAVLIPQSSCTKKQYYAIVDSNLDVRNAADGTIEITTGSIPEIALPLNVLYSANAVMISMPQIYKEENAVYEFTLRAADWTGESAPYTQTVVVEDLNPNMYGAVSLAEDYTAQELRAAILAKIDFAQQDNMVIFKATEEKPTVDIRGYITYGNNVAMSFYPLANSNGLMEAADVSIDNSIIDIDGDPKNVQTALKEIWNRMVRTTDGNFDITKKLEVKIGMCFFDTVLGKPVWCKSKNPYVFVDAMGEEVYTV